MARRADEQRCSARPIERLAWLWVNFDPPVDHKNTESNRLRERERSFVELWEKEGGGG